MNGIAYPYLRPAPETVGASSWQLSVDGRPHIPLLDQIEGWDYAADLDFIRSVTINTDELARQIGADSRTLEVELVVTLATGKGRFGATRQIVWRSAVTGAECREDVHFAVAGGDLSHRLSLTSELILGTTPFVLSSLAPHLPGSRLWADTAVAALEPIAPRFPVEVTSFSSNLRARAGDSPWFLDWSPRDLLHEFASSVQLYINADLPELVQRVRSADAVTLRLIMSGVMTQLARGVLPEESFSLSLLDEHPTSVGGAVASWLTAAFPGLLLQAIRTLAELEPSRFDAAIATHSGQMGIG